MSALLRRVKWLFRREEFERDLEEEMRHHLAMKTEGSGERDAARSFGNVARLKEDSRAAWGFAFLEQLALDVRYALRTMRTNGLFTAMAVLSLALGIGANTAIYSFMHAILLESLPVKNPGELAVFTWHSPRRAWVVHGMNGSMFRYGKGGNQSPNFPYAAWQMLRDSGRITSELFAYAPAGFNLVARNRADVMAGMYISGNFYSGLGSQRYSAGSSATVMTVRAQRGLR